MWCCRSSLASELVLFASKLAVLLLVGPVTSSGSFLPPVLSWASDGNPLIHSSNSPRQSPRWCLPACWRSPSVRQPSTPPASPFWHCDSASEMSPSSLFSICLLWKSTKYRYLLWQAGWSRGELLLESRWDKQRVDRNQSGPLSASGRWWGGHVPMPGV